MRSPLPTEVPDSQSHTGTSQPAPASRGLTAFGGWLFKHRTIIPVPVVLALLLVRTGEIAPSTATAVGGAALVALGELVRLWAVRHIGAISRTRADRLGPLVVSGPFGLVRNPLYLGNLLMWIGFSASARLPWMIPVVLAVIGFEYHAIVRWEEQLLLVRRGPEYRAYLARVPRWVPALVRPAAVPPGPVFSWRETLYSERGTLIAIGVGFLLLTLKGALA